MEMTKSWFLLTGAILLIIIAVPLLFTDDSQADNYVARIGDVYYPSLNEALEASSSGNTIVVFDGCRLSSDAILPPGVTLLLPYSDGHGEVDMDGLEYGPDPTKEGGYRKKAGDGYCVTHLYIEDSARLTVFGDIIVGGILSEKFTFDYQGHTYGEHGRIVLNGDIVMKNGSSMRCYGYVTGNGTVTAENGSEIYEPFIIADFVGGDRMRDLFNAGQSPFDRYSFNNIESDLIIDYGSRLIGLLNVYADGSIHSSEIDIIGVAESHSTSLIEMIQNSNVTISYDKNTYVKSEWSSNIWNDIGRTTITMNGGAAFNTLTLIYGEYFVDLSGIPFSIPYNYRYVLKNGLYEINTDLRVLPGASITIDDGATLAVNSTLLIFDGLEDVAYRDKYYPGPELLDEYHFSTHGSLYVNGSLRISEDSAVLGMIESTGGNPIVTVDNSVNAYKDWYVNYGTKETLTIRKLSLWTYSNGSLTVLQPGYQYPLSVGSSLSSGFTYYRGGSTVFKSIPQRYDGIYVSPTQQPTISVTVSLDNTAVKDAVVTAVRGDFVTVLEYESGRYVSYTATDGGYDIRLTVSGTDLDGGKVTVSQGKCAVEISLFTVSFVSDDVTIKEEIVKYDSNVTIPSTSKDGYTICGWYEGKIIFTSKSTVTHKTTLNALWAKDTDEHRNVTPDKLPVVITDATEDVTAFFDEGRTKVFISTREKTLTGSLNITYTMADGNHRFIVESDGVKVDVLKTMTVPYDIMRKGLRVECDDGYEISDVIADAASQTVTFSSMGSSFTLCYDDDPTPFDPNAVPSIEMILLVVSAVIVSAIIIIALFIFIRQRKK